jgi:hypothetical protein
MGPSVDAIFCHRKVLAAISAGDTEAESTVLFIPYTAKTKIPSLVLFTLYFQFSHAFYVQFVLDVRVTLPFGVGNQPCHEKQLLKFACNPVNRRFGRLYTRVG